MLQTAIQNILLRLSSTLELLEDDQYVKLSQHLKESSIGQHVRHIIELFQELDNGYKSGIVNYENRKRDRQIETNKNIAIQLLNKIPSGIERPDKELILETCPDENKSKFIQISTNYQRELAYNLDHAIHHMAMIRVAIKEVSDLQLSESFGVAFSTIKFKKSCVQ